MTSIQLGKKIREARKAMKLTQADLAYRVGISAQLISAFEAGRISPAREYLEKIAQFTHTPTYVFTGHQQEEALARLAAVEKEIAAIRQLFAGPTNE